MSIHVRKSIPDSMMHHSKEEEGIRFQDYVRREHRGELPLNHSYNMSSVESPDDNRRHESAFSRMQYTADSKYRWKKIQGNLDLFVMERNERHLTSMQWKWQKMSRSKKRFSERESGPEPGSELTTMIKEAEHDPRYSPSPESPPQSKDSGLPNQAYRDDVTETSRARSRGQSRQKMQEDLEAHFYERWKVADDRHNCKSREQSEQKAAKVTPNFLSRTPQSDKHRSEPNRYVRNYDERETLQESDYYQTKLNYEKRTNDRLNYYKQDHDRISKQKQAQNKKWFSENYHHFNVKPSHQAKVKSNYHRDEMGYQQHHRPPNFYQQVPPKQLMDNRLTSSHLFRYSQGERQRHFFENSARFKYPQEHLSTYPRQQANINFVYSPEYDTKSSHELAHFHQSLPTDVLYQNYPPYLNNQHQGRFDYADPWLTKKQAFYEPNPTAYEAAGLYTRHHVTRDGIQRPKMNRAMIDPAEGDEMYVTQTPRRAMTAKPTNWDNYNESMRVQMNKPIFTYTNVAEIMSPSCSVSTQEEQEEEDFERSHEEEESVENDDQSEHLEKDTAGVAQKEMKPALKSVKKHEPAVGDEKQQKETGADKTRASSAASTATKRKRTESIVFMINGQKCYPGKEEEKDEEKEKNEEEKTAEKEKETTSTTKEEQVDAITGTEENQKEKNESSKEQTPHEEDKSKNYISRSQPKQGSTDKTLTFASSSGRNSDNDSSSDEKRKTLKKKVLIRRRFKKSSAYEQRQGSRRSKSRNIKTPSDEYSRREPKENLSWNVHRENAAALETNPEELLIDFGRVETPDVQHNVAHGFDYTEIANDNTKPVQTINRDIENILQKFQITPLKLEEILTRRYETAEVDRRVKPEADIKIANNEADNHTKSSTIADHHVSTNSFNLLENAMPQRQELSETSTPSTSLLNEKIQENLKSLSLLSSSRGSRQRNNLQSFLNTVVPKQIMEKITSRKVPAKQQLKGPDKSAEDQGKKLRGNPSIIAVQAEDLRNKYESEQLTTLSDKSIRNDKTSFIETPNSQTEEPVSAMARKEKITAKNGQKDDINSTENKELNQHKDQDQPADTNPSKISFVENIKVESPVCFKKKKVDSISVSITENNEQDELKLNCEQSISGKCDQKPNVDTSAKIPRTDDTDRHAQLKTTINMKQESSEGVSGPKEGGYDMGTINQSNKYDAKNEEPITISECSIYGEKYEDSKSSAESEPQQQKDNNKASERSTLVRTTNRLLRQQNETEKQLQDLRQLLKVELDEQDQSCERDERTQERIDELEKQILSMDSKLERINHEITESRVNSQNMMSLDSRGTPGTPLFIIDTPHRNQHEITKFAIPYEEEDENGDYYDPADDDGQTSAYDTYDHVESALEETKMQQEDLKNELQNQMMNMRAELEKQLALQMTVATANETAGNNEEMDARVTYLEKQIEDMQKQIKVADEKIADTEIQKQRIQKKKKASAHKKAAKKVSKSSEKSSAASPKGTIRNATSPAHKRLISKTSSKVSPAPNRKLPANVASSLKTSTHERRSQKSEGHLTGGGGSSIKTSTNNDRKSSHKSELQQSAVREEEDELESKHSPTKLLRCDVIINVLPSNLTDEDDVINLDAIDEESSVENTELRKNGLGEGCLKLEHGEFKTKTKETITTTGKDEIEEKKIENCDAINENKRNFEENLDGCNSAEADISNDIKIQNKTPEPDLELEAQEKASCQPAEDSDCPVCIVLNKQKEMEIVEATDTKNSVQEVNLGKVEASSVAITTSDEEKETTTAEAAPINIQTDMLCAEENKELNNENSMEQTMGDSCKEVTAQSHISSTFIVENEKHLTENPEKTEKTEERKVSEKENVEGGDCPPPHKGGPVTSTLRKEEELTTKPDVESDTSTRDLTEEKQVQEAQSVHESSVEDLGNIIITEDPENDMPSHEAVKKQTSITTESNETHAADRAMNTTTIDEESTSNQFKHDDRNEIVKTDSKIGHKKSVHFLPDTSKHPMDDKKNNCFASSSNTPVVVMVETDDDTFIEIEFAEEEDNGMACQSMEELPEAKIPQQREQLAKTDRSKSKKEDPAVQLIPGRAKKQDKYAKDERATKKQSTLAKTNTHLKQKDMLEVVKDSELPTTTATKSELITMKAEHGLKKEIDRDAVKEFPANSIGNCKDTQLNTISEASLKVKAYHKKELLPMQSKTERLNTSSCLQTPVEKFDKSISLRDSKISKKNPELKHASKDKFAVKDSVKAKFRASTVTENSDLMDRIRALKEDLHQTKQPKNKTVSTKVIMEEKNTAVPKSQLETDSKLQNEHLSKNPAPEKAKNDSTVKQTNEVERVTLSPINEKKNEKSKIEEKVTISSSSKWKFWRKKKVPGKAVAAPEESLQNVLAKPDSNQNEVENVTNPEKIESDVPSASKKQEEVKKSDVNKGKELPPSEDKTKPEIIQNGKKKSFLSLFLSRSSSKGPKASTSNSKVAPAPEHSSEESKGSVVKCKEFAANKEMSEKSPASSASLSGNQQTLSVSTAKTKSKPSQSTRMTLPSQKSSKRTESSTAKSKSHKTLSRASSKKLRSVSTLSQEKEVEKSSTSGESSGKESKLIINEEDCDENQAAEIASQILDDMSTFEEVQLDTVEGDGEPEETAAAKAMRDFKAFFNFNFKPFEAFKRKKRRKSVLHGLGTNWCVCPNAFWKYLGDEQDEEIVTRRKCISLILGIILIILLLAIVGSLAVGLSGSEPPEKPTESPLQFTVINADET